MAFWRDPDLSPYPRNPFAVFLGQLGDIAQGAEAGKEQRAQNIFAKKQQAQEEWRMEREKQLAVLQDELAKLNKSTIEMTNEEARKKLELFDYYTTLEATQDPKKALPLAPEWFRKQFEVSESVVKPPEAKQVTGVFGKEGEPMPPPQMQKQAMVASGTMQTGEGAVPSMFTAPPQDVTTETVFTPPTAVPREAQPGNELFAQGGKTYEVPINYEVQKHIFSQQLSQLQLEQQTIANTTSKLSYNLTLAGLPDQIAEPIAQYAAQAILSGRPQTEVMNEIEGRLSRYSAQGVTGLLEPRTIYKMAYDAATQARQAYQMEYTKMMLPYTLEKPGGSQTTGKPQTRMYENSLGIIGMPTLTATAKNAVGADTGMAENSCAKTVGDIVNATLGTTYDWDLSVEGIEPQLQSRGFTEVQWGDAQPGDIIISMPKGAGHTGDGVNHTAVLSSYIQPDGSFSMISGRGSTVAQESWNTSIYKNMRIYRAPGGAARPGETSNTDINRILNKEFGTIGGADALLTPEAEIRYRNMLTDFDNELARAEKIPGYPTDVIKTQRKRVQELLANHEKVKVRWIELTGEAVPSESSSEITSALDFFG